MLRNQERERWRETDQSSVHWFTFQAAITTRAGIGWNQKHWTPSESPVWVAETQAPGLPPTVFPEVLAGNRCWHHRWCFASLTHNSGLDKWHLLGFLCYLHQRQVKECECGSSRLKCHTMKRYIWRTMFIWFLANITLKACVIRVQLMVFQCLKAGNCLSFVCFPDSPEVRASISCKSQIMQA